jgi:hypothetical protein
MRNLFDNKINYEYILFFINIFIPGGLALCLDGCKSLL